MKNNQGQLKGMDISHFQTNICWEKIKESKIKFAMIKATQGKNYQDDYFKTHVSGAKAVGIETGAYHYFTALSMEDTKAEANNFLSTIEKSGLTYPVVLDVEDQKLTKVSKEELISCILLFLNLLEKEKYYAMIYANREWHQGVLSDPRFDRFDRWLAEYRENPTYKKPIGMWQYTETGTVNGVKGKVDLDIAFKDYAEIIKGMR